MTLIALPCKGGVLSIRRVCGGLCIQDEARISPAAYDDRPVRKGFTVAGNPSLIGIDHQGVSEES